MVERIAAGEANREGIVAWLERRAAPVGRTRLRLNVHPRRVTGPAEWTLRGIVERPFLPITRKRLCKRVQSNALSSVPSGRMLAGSLTYRLEGATAFGPQSMGAEP
jgi:hypothetical protein